MLQIQMRDLDGFAITRNTLLALKPNAKINWMAFALARHLTGELRGAVKVIDTYMGTLTEGSPELGRCFESGELALYKNSILAEIPGNYKEALDHLNVCEGIVVDRGALLMKRGEYQLKLKDYVAVRRSVMQMFQRGMTENHTVHSLYMCAVLELEGSECDEALKLPGTQTLATMMPLSDQQKKRLQEAYEKELAPFSQNSNAIQRIPYSLLDDESLRPMLDLRCRKDLSKGVPSLCSELRSYLWTDKDGRFVRTEDPVDIKSHQRYKMIVDMVDGYTSNLESTSKFASDDEKEEPPSTLLWAWYLRAALHEMAGELIEGVALLDKCLEHTPTLVDIYELKSALLKSAGDIQAAVDCLEKGRELDLQDRYINNQTAKYMLQAGKDEEALKRIALFTKHEGNPEQNLYDMQCSWYELESAASLARKEDWGRSLKKYGECWSPEENS
jgi:tetratricopeptide (TPR) repeat protein